MRVLTKDSSIMLLGLSTRPANCMSAENIDTIGRLCSWTAAELIKSPNLGVVSRYEIMERLHKFGFKLACGTDCKPDSPESAAAAEQARKSRESARRECAIFREVLVSKTFRAAGNKFGITGKYAKDCFYRVSWALRRYLRNVKKIESELFSIEEMRVNQNYWLSLAAEYETIYQE